MKFKLDENFGNRTKNIFLNAGFDADTVLDEEINGFPDNDIYNTVIKENRTLVTLDLDFSNTINYPPETTKGIIVVRPPHPISLKTLETLINQLITHIKKENNPDGQLWILELGRVRIRQRK
ncbi:MAG: DUF5615 family PIN-like protein [Spirosomaceae bacterium]|nr:DUF5615 family PIN-like protein [Spirosomataceae bacterium]